MTHLTNLVEFPALGLSFPLNRVAFSIGGINIYWYGVCIAVGMCLALVFAFRHGVEFGVDADAMVDVILIGVVMGILCARLYYVAMAPYNYDSLWEVLAIRDGGLAIYGGIIGGAITLLVVAKRKKIPAPVLLDVAGMGVIIGQLMGRWGNFMNREAHGAVTDTFLKMGLQDASGVVTYYHPTFLYESVWNLIGFIGVHFFSKKRKFDGEVFLAYVAWYGLGRVLIEGLRTDSLYLFHWTLFGQRIRVSQALSLVMVLVCAGILVYQFKVKKADGSNLFVKRVQQTTEAEEAAAEPTAPDEKQ